MSGPKTEKRALKVLKAFEAAGKSVGSVTFEGRKIQITFAKPQSSDEFEEIDMGYDKT